MLTNSMQMDVDAVIYPSYKTQGYVKNCQLRTVLPRAILTFQSPFYRNLKQAVDGLSDWLLEETQKREADIRRLGGKGHVLVVL